MKGRMEIAIYHGKQKEYLLCDKLSSVKLPALMVKAPPREELFRKIVSIKKPESEDGGD